MIETEKPLHEWSWEEDGHRYRLMDGGVLCTIEIAPVLREILRLARRVRELEADNHPPRVTPEDFAKLEALKAEREQSQADLAAIQRELRITPINWTDNASNASGTLNGCNWPISAEPSPSGGGDLCACGHLKVFHRPFCGCSCRTFRPAPTHPVASGEGETPRHPRNMQDRIRHAAAHYASAKQLPNLNGESDEAVKEAAGAVNNLAAEAQAAVNERDRLKVVVNRLEKDCKELVEERDLLSDRIGKVEKARNWNISEVGRLYEEMLTLRTARDAAERRVSSLEVSLQVAQNQLAAARAERDAAVNERDRLRERVEELKAGIDEAHTAGLQILRARDAALMRVKELEERPDLSLVLKQLSADLVAAEQRVKEIEDTLASIGAIRRELERDVQSIGAERNNLRAALAKAERRVKELEDGWDQMHEKLAWAIRQEGESSRLLRALVEALNECLECDAPATQSVDGLTSGIALCDEHKHAGYTDLPYAPALRAAQAHLGKGGR